ncbi:hypothetical protein BX661DRAFT_185769 [Kickxella alabastrina]|uniref:uncharacterized protein n=1 Tax=Kickxella alabastrina TaxID=61397 RepID=UPI0022211E53|nr:uncharacterized protein BX661DRAFT_185769 [Kickxella alabastrina]KAI7824229.1 hypothetical protein BX661DRAFT_185769 [Kickxella alabastrina]
MNQSTNSKKHKQLFVKEGDDFEYQKGASTGGDSYRTSVYRHCDSEMRIVVCRIPRPLCTLHIYVPTVTDNDKGLPHTLEHLIFCGSERYPNRGYLDALANCNFADGTNAWTSYDHTCYTLSVASEQAVTNVLPVYLDHVLHPLLRDDQFVTEVYHYDATGKEQGVVFSEMVSREQSESDLSSHHLRKLMFSSNSAYTFETGGLTPDIANLSNQEIIDYHRKYYDVNNITVVMTGAFSEDFEEVLQGLPVDMLKSNGCNSRAPIDCSVPPEDRCRFEFVKFPSADADTGSISFGWRGPQPEDIETQAALGILMEYLAENPSSPLNQRFVERPEPLANYVYHDLESTMPSTLTISFGGVPYPKADSEADENHEEDEDEGEDGKCSGDEGTGSVQEDDEEEDENDSDSQNGEQDPDIPLLFDECYFERLLLAEIQRVYDTHFDGDSKALKNSTERVRQKLAVDMENNPECVIQDAMCADIIAAHFSPSRQGGAFRIGKRAKMFDIIDKLGRKPMDYWLDLLKTWFIDQQPYHVVMVPDAEMGSRLEAARKEVEKANEASIVDKEAHARAIAQAIEANKVDLPDSVKQTIPSPDPSLIITLPHTLNVLPLPNAASPAAAVQLIEVDSEFPEIKLHIPMNSLPDSLRAYLVLFQELLLCSDVMLPAGIVYDTDAQPLAEPKRVGYVTVDNRLADIATSNGAAVGYGNGRFSCSWLDELFYVYMRMPDDKFALGVRWLVQVFMFADFTAERILSVAQNLLSEIVDLKRDGESMAFAVSSLYTTEDREGGPRWVANHISVFEQESVLKGIVDKVKGGDVKSVVSVLNGIQRALIYGQGGFLSMGIPTGKSGQAYIDEFSREWAVCLDKYAESQKAESAVPCVADKGRPLFGNNGLFPVPRVNRFPDMASPLRLHFPMAALQSSYVNICFNCDLYKGPVGSSERSFDEQLAELPSMDYYALNMLASLLHRTDGPLYNAIRGKGYAYGAYFHPSQWAGMMSFICPRAADAPKAILEMQQLVRALETEWDEYVGDFEISMTRSTLVYENTIAQATPNNVANSCVVSNINGFESVEQLDRWRNAHMAAVGQKELRRVYELYLRRFLDAEYPMLSVIMTPLDTELPVEIGVYERKMLDELATTALRSVV